MKKIVITILSNLPLFLSKYLIRKKYDFSMKPPEGIIFKIAETKNEIEQAFRVVQQSYKDINIVNQEAGEFRITKHHALPTTSIIIAKLDDKVIAAVSIITKLKFSLPIEDLFSIAELCKMGRTCEISSLAILKEHRSMAGKITLPLMIFTFHYSYHYLGNTVMVFCVHPRAAVFYKALFELEQISKDIKVYKSINNAPAVGLYCRMKDYGQKHGPFKSKHHQFLSSLVNKNYDWMKLTEGRYKFPLGRILKHDLFNYFFVEKSSIFNDLEHDEKQFLKEVYNIKKNEFPTDSDKYYLYVSARLLIHEELIDIDTSFLTKNYIHTKSLNTYFFKNEESALLQIDLSRYDSLTVKVKIVSEGDGTNLMITHSDQWSDFINYIHHDINNEKENTNLKNAA